MPIEIFQNLAKTTLNGSINNSVTSIVVTSGAVFPATGNFRIVCESEIMFCTARSTNTLTVVRGYEGTTAASHADLLDVVHVLTAGSFSQWLNDRGILPIALGDRKPTTAGTYDEEFEGTADTLPANWAWTSAPSGSDEFTVNSRWPSLLTLEGTGNGTFTLTRSSFNPGSIDFGIWAKIHNGPAVGSNKCDFRMYVKNSGSTEGRCLEIYQPTTNSTDTRALKTVSSSESVWGGPVVQVPGITAWYIGMTRSSANSWNAYYSTNGISWQWLGPTETHSFTVDKIIFSMDTAAVRSLSGIDWVRYRTDLLLPRF